MIDIVERDKAYSSAKMAEENAAKAVAEWVKSGRSDKVKYDLNINKSLFLSFFLSFFLSLMAAVIHAVVEASSRLRP